MTGSKILDVDYTNDGSCKIKDHKPMINYCTYGSNEEIKYSMENLRNELPLNL